jgi:ATP-dependent DNA helicase RecG
MFVKEKGKITNKEYQELCSISKPMATIDLRGLVEKGVFEKAGITGRGTEYILLRQRANNGLKGLTKG